MSEWIGFERWGECTVMERPGMVFEVVNVQGQSLLTPCVERLDVPWDWTSAPVRFRLVAAPKPRRSTPLPSPAPRPPDGE